MPKKKVCLLFLSYVLIINASAQVVFNIQSHGVEEGGQKLCTEGIQTAIDLAHQAKGGKVVIPRGIFLCGSLHLKSNVELHLEKGAVLLGSTNIEDYRAISRNGWKALIMADGAENIAISGKGKIDGQGTALALKIDGLFYAGKLDSSLYQLKERRPVAHARPQIIQFVSCRNVSVTDISIHNSASWVQTYDLCDGVILDGIRVESVAYWNNDGIDIIDSKNVRITNCFVNASDDGICLKSYQRAGGLVAFCDSIYIAHCTVRSSACAVKLGTSSFGGFRNVVVENIKVYDTYRSAIAIECWEPGLVENIRIENIVASNTGNAIFIRLGQRGIFKNYPVGSLRNVVIRNVKVTVPFEQPDRDYDLRGPALPFFHNVFPSSITGIPGYPVQNVHLENITITYPGRGSQRYANMPTHRLWSVPEKIEDYPEFSMFGELPAWALYARHVDGLTMNKIRVRIKRPDYRPAMVFDDVNNLELRDIQISGDKKPEPIIYNEPEFPR